MKERQTKEEKQMSSSKLAGTHLAPATRGRIFEGRVIKKFPKRVVIEFERTVFVQKYERFTKKKTRIHARLPDSLNTAVHVGDHIQVQECRPLSKIIHHRVIKKIRSATNTMQHAQQQEATA